MKRLARTGASKPRVASVLLLTAFTLTAGAPPSPAAQRPGDTEIANDLRQYAASAEGAQRQLLALCEAASGDAQFTLYWAYNQSTGTWLQVEFLGTLLDGAVAATSATEERRIRTNLRDQALFTLWQLDQNLAHPTRSVAPEHPELPRLAANLSSLLRGVRLTVLRLTADP